MRSHAEAWQKTGSITYEEDIPAEQPPSPHEARLPPAHAHPFRSRRDQPSPRQGPQVPLCLSFNGIAVERLKSHRDFVAVLKRRRRVSREDIVVHYLVHDDVCDIASADASAKRIGLAVSKAVGNAVTRNAVKRRFRVLAKKYEADLPESCDIVLRAKPSAAHADFQSLDRQMSELFAAVRRKAVR